MDKNRSAARFLLKLGVLILMAFVLVVPVSAFEGRGGNEVVIPAGEVVEDDLYVGANTFRLRGTIRGDLVAFGATVMIEEGGVVEGDLIAAGQSVVIEGQVLDDARIAGYALTLGEAGQVAGDLVAAAFSLENRAGSSVGGDVIYAGGQAILAGNIEGDVQVGAAGLELRGIVGGNVDADVGQAGVPLSSYTYMPNTPQVPRVSSGLTIGPEASIAGDLNYRSPTEFEIPAGVVGGKLSFQEQVRAGAAARTPTALDWFFENLRTLVTLLLVGLLLVWLAPRFTRQSAELLRAHPLPSLGWGLVSIFGVFFALMILVFLVIILALLFGLISLGNLAWTTVLTGILVGFGIIMAFVIAVTYVSKIVVSFLGGRLILERLNPGLAGSRVWPLVLGVIIFAIFAAIPWLGGLFSLVVILLGLGALVLLGWERFQPRPAETAAAD